MGVVVADWSPAASVTPAPSKGPGDSPFPGWETYIPQLVHPVKVAVVEALLWIGEPLSATQLAKLFSGAGEGFREPNVRYHLRYLIEVGVLEHVSCGPSGDASGRGRFAFFASRVASEAIPSHHS